MVKNAYDADAHICIVYFDNKNLDIPQSLSGREFEEYKAQNPSIEAFYKPKEMQSFQLIGNITKAQRVELENFFKTRCNLYIIDNGEGMTSNVIRKNWMTIGTDLKEHEVFSKNGRVRVGAKGIGRFSLDRLGEIGEMVTLPEKGRKGNQWKVNWGDFERKGAAINDVTASLTEIEQMDYPEAICQMISDERIRKIVYNSSNKFDHGTLLKVSRLRDIWAEKLIERIFSNLEILTPPEGRNNFKIYIYDTLSPEKYGEVDVSSFSDYDYKLKVTYNGEDKNLEFQVHRAEFDFELIDKDVFKYEDMKNSPFDKETFRKEKFEFSQPLFELMPGLKTTHKEGLIDKIGKFDFHFYYLKNQMPNREDREKYFYKEFKSTVRSQWLKKFGGIRIFKDGFRVRPYGDPNTSSYDWLRLGERQAKDPAGVARKGAYRVRPNQVAGTINISRLKNLELSEKSSREGIQENETLAFFKNIIIAVIRKFEDDRSTIAFNLDKLYKEKNRGAEYREKVEKILADEAGSDEIPEKTPEQLKSENITFKKVYKSQKKELEEKTEELNLSRSLASAGLMIASFAHEFKSIRNRLDTRAFYLKKYLKKILNEEKLATAPDHQNPFIMIDDIKKTDAKIMHWVDFSLGLIRKDKRRTKYVKLSGYFKELKKLWLSLLAERNIELKVQDQLSEHNEIKLKIFEVDLDTIFDNLLINSIEAFQVSGFSGKRIIEIELMEEPGGILISYRDSGPGLSKDIRNPREIFKPFYTTKKDELGNDVGTGLGMWLLKSTVDDYKGKINFFGKRDGFNLDVLFPKK